MKLTLHIGTEKTGTTTLQHWFSSNRELLRMRGVYYPTSLGSRNHRNLAIFAIGNNNIDRKEFYRKKIFSAEDYQVFLSNLANSFDDECSKMSEVENWVISNEHLHSHLVNVENVEKVKQFFGKKFSDIKIVVHLRPQVDVAVSRVSTGSRNGKKVNSNLLLKQLDPSNPYYNYNRLVRRWESVFGTDSVTVVPFKKQPCMTSFLLDSFGLSKEELPPIERRNEFIDWRVMMLINSLSIPRFRTDKSINQNKNFFISDLPGNERLSIGLDMAKQIQSRFKESNVKLISRRKDLETDDLTPHWHKYDSPANIHYLDETPVFAEQLSYLVMRLNWEVKLERCSTRLAESEREIVSNNLLDARRFLEDAKGILVTNSPLPKTIDDRLKKMMAKIEKLSERLL